MPSRKIKQVDGIGRKELSSAVEEFLRHCKLKNLAKATMAYYTEDLTYLFIFPEIVSPVVLCGLCAPCMIHYSTPILKHVTFLVHVFNSQ